MFGTLDLSATWAVWMWGQFWQLLALCFFIYVIDLATRRVNWPHFRLALWSLVPVKLVVPPWLVASWSVSSGWFDFNGVPFVVQAWLGAIDPLLSRSSGGVAANFAAGSAHITNAWIDVAFLIWLSGFIFLSSLYLLRYVRLSRVVNREFRRTVAPDWLRTELESVSRDLGLPRAPRMAISESVRVPAVFGLLRPTVLFPNSWLNVRREDARHILRHELAHIIRCDLQLNLATSFLGMAYWFVPMVYFARRKVAILRELCCDALAVEQLRDASRYRETLIRTARVLFENPDRARQQPAISLMDDASHLRDRLRALQTSSIRFARRKRITGVGLVAALAIFLLPMGRTPLPQPCEHDRCQRGAANLPADSNSAIQRSVHVLPN